MQNGKKNRPLFHLDHPRPVTRRQMLAQGFIASAATTLVPTLGTLLGSMTARADEDCGAPVAGALPFLVFDCAGGAALPANFLVGGAGGPDDLLSSYSRIGWNPRTATIDRRFGLPMAGTQSGILQGILVSASADAIARTRMGSFCHFGFDDTSRNKSSAVTLIAKAGARGSFISRGIGIRDTASGGNSDVVLDDPTLRPLAVQSLRDILNSVSFGAAFTGMRPDEVSKMARGTLGVSLEHIAALPATEQGELLGRLARCGYEANVRFTQGTNNLDPRLNTEAQNVYGINQNSTAEDPLVVSAALAMNALNGYSGPGIWTIGGCDYHGSSQQESDGKDLEIGIAIGRSIELAHRLAKPLVFQILTDGGCSTQEGSRSMQSDAGDKSMTVLGYYRPEGAPAQRQAIQVGHYTQGQGADRNSLIGADADRVAYAVLANYLNISGRIGEVFDYLPAGLFTAEEVDSLVIFD